SSRNHRTCKGDSPVPVGDCAIPEVRTKPAGRLTKVLYGPSIPLVTLLAAAGGVTAPTAAAPSSTAAAFASPVASPSPVASALALHGLLGLTTNPGPSLPAPADQPQAMIRHVNLQVRTNESGNPGPYLAVSMDLLLDGHPIASGLPVKPMVAAESTVPQLYYGNNLKLTQRGTYQVFIRLQPSALLGKDQPQAAQFNVVVR